jgi:HD-like signal output (HDOD) protein/DNA-binding response OmpR family regulator
MVENATKILIAEDNNAVRRLLEVTLTTWGYTVVAVGDGKKAWEQLQSPHAPKLALLDWQMPGMNGVEVCRKVQQTESKITPYLILLTSHDAKENIVEGLGAGANDFIAKTCDKDVLRARLEVGRRAIELQMKLVSAPKEDNCSPLKEKEEMEKTILALKQKALELEERLAAEGKGDSQKPVSHSNADASILDEIIVVFKRGEINLPSPPQIGVKFKELINNGANLQQIGTVLKQDASVTSKLISISNSAFYRGVAENKTLEQAVGRLGLKTTKQYVDAIANRSLYYTKNKNLKDIIENLWEHSLACAYASQNLCQVQKFNPVQDPFTLGLLHDIGRLVLLQAVGELQSKKKIGEDLDKEELSNTISSNHGKFGAALLKRWKFSDEYIHISNYHDDLGEAETITNELLVVHFANLLVKSMGYHSLEPVEVNLEATPSFNLLKLDDEKIETIKNRTATHMDEMKGYFT